MQREEVKGLLAMVQGLFPNFKPESKTLAVNGWHMLLEDESFDNVKKALKIYCKTNTSGFAPNPAQLLKIIRDMDADYMNELEAWGKVRKSIRNGIYGSKEEFAKLPEVIKRAVGSHETIREWAMQDTDVIESVIMSQFIKSYRVTAERMTFEQYADIKPERMLETKDVEMIEEKTEKEFVQMPDAVRERLEEKFGKL